jgi:pimeloyl-ACP methyl ester carboxylesterase
MTFGDDVTVQKLDEGLLRFLRTRNQAQYTIRTPRGVDEGRYIPVGGIEQWITIRGEDRSNPVLLFLHGGPGDVTNPWSFTVFAPWLRHFTVVQWDQRGAGRTLRKSGSGDAGTMTLDRMTQDGIAVAEYLKGYLGKPKILLVAHSFGSILGLRMVSARPDLFSAYVGTGQVGDNTRNYAVAFEVLLEKARKSGEVQAVAELQRVGPPPYATGEGFQIQRKWANRFEGADTFLNGTIGLTLVAPGGSVQDLQDSANGQILSAERLVRQTNVLTSADLGLQFDTGPVGPGVSVTDPRTEKGLRNDSRWWSLCGLHEVSGVSGSDCAANGTMTNTCPLRLRARNRLCRARVRRWRRLSAVGRDVLGRFGFDSRLL